MVVDLLTFKERLLLQLNANENIYGAPAQVLDAIQLVDHHVYPDPAQVKLRAGLAKLMKVSLQFDMSSHDSFS